jgi:hypothetical protein
MIPGTHPKSTSPVKGKRVTGFAFTCLAIAEFLCCACASSAHAQPHEDVSNLDLFSSFEHNVSIYHCSIVKRVRTNSERNIERGNIELNVITTLRGTNRPGIILPYISLPATVSPVDGPMVWPPLDGVRDIICFIVPGTEDPDAGSGKSRFTEAASKVSVVKNARTAIREVKTICKLYDLKGTPEDFAELKRALAERQPTVRDFALKSALINLSKDEPEAALKVIQTEASHYQDHAKGRPYVEDPLNGIAYYGKYIFDQLLDQEDVAEAEALICFIRSRNSPFTANIETRKFLFRCLVVLAQSSSSLVRQKSVAAMAKSVSDPAYLPKSRMQDALTNSEKMGLIKVLRVEIKSEKAETSSNAGKLWKWLGNEVEAAP